MKLSMKLNKIENAKLNRNTIKSINKNNNLVCYKIV